MILQALGCHRPGFRCTHQRWRRSTYDSHLNRRGPRRPLPRITTSCVAVARWSRSLPAALVSAQPSHRAARLTDGGIRDRLELPRGRILRRRLLPPVVVLLPRVLTGQRRRSSASIVPRKEEPKRERGAAIVWMWLAGSERVEKIRWKEGRVDWTVPIWSDACAHAARRESACGADMYLFPKIYETIKIFFKNDEIYRKEYHTKKYKIRTWPLLLNSERS
jgi:hypothetical protein